MQKVESSNFFSRFPETPLPAALRPELAPKLNGEWEWIAVTLADLD
jgi:hypothetical protein